MSEIKFACPHCSQHIACEDAYCGERIDCPSCKTELYVPPLAVFIPPSTGKVTVMLPVASKERRYPRSAGLDFWSEQNWEQHASEMGVVQQSRLMPLWLLLVLPFVVAFILLMHRVGIAAIGWCFVLCALAAGIYLAKLQKKSGLGMILAVLLYSFTALFVYMTMAVGLLFVGCIAVLG